jgi:ATP-dependent RNA helicase HelY
MPEMPPATLLDALGSYRLLPAIVFLPTRRRCDQAASEAAFVRRDPNAERRDARREFIRKFVEEHPEVRGHRHWDTIIKGGIASHHAGHIPAWKLVIEHLMSAGLLDAIFATATVAAGVDFPARTVVLTGTDARTGRGWRSLTASELQQMTGRAGRRGRDNVGFVVAAPGLHQDPEKIAALLKAPPDPLVSQFRATYTTLLNLLDAYGNFAQVRAIASHSFAHRDTARRITKLETEIVESEATITNRLAAAGCNVPNSLVRGLERLVSARGRLQEKKPQTRAELFWRWLDEEVRPGRIVGIGRSGKRLAMVTHRFGGNVGVVREDGHGSTFPLDRIGRVYQPIYQLREKEIENAFDEVRRRGAELVLAEPRLRHAQAEDAEAVALLDQIIDSLMIVDAPADKSDYCKEVLWASLADAEKIERARFRIERLQDQIWEPFEMRARVLAAFGYLRFEEQKVTERGRWLADLHIDRPLIVGEALERDLFRALDPIRLAAVLAALTADEDRDYGELELEDSLVSSLANFEEIAFQISNEEWKFGIDPTAELNFSAAGAASRWVSGIEWKQLVAETRAEEGDLFRMLSRTGEALLQIAGLRRVHPHAAEMASQAAEVVLREPVR